MNNNDRYQGGKVYKLVNDVDNEIYVGSTCMPLAKRFYQHKSRAKKELERHVYKHLNEIGWENVKIILIEEYPCQSKMALEKKERQFIEELSPSLNKQLPCRTPQEYKAKQKIRDAERYQVNKENIKAKRRDFYQRNKERERAKYDQNKDAIKAKQRAKYVQNKAKILEKRSTPEYKAKQKIRDAERYQVNKEAILAKRRNPEYNAKRRARYAAKKLKRQQEAEDTA